MNEPLRIVPDPMSKGVPLELVIRVEDREMIADLEGFPEGRERTTFALNALRIGLLALKQARGRIDADAVKSEGERILALLAVALAAHEKHLTSQVKTTLSTYFDPQSGHFNERVERLLKKDGELETALKRQIGGEDSDLARTLAANVGLGSPILKLLSPTQTDGVVSMLRRGVESELGEQRKQILAQFDLNVEGSALSRLLTEVKSKSGELGTDLKLQIDRAVKELSLDESKSALSLLKAELLKVLADQSTVNARFQEDVRVTLERLAARKAEAARSTRHGEVFEEALRSFVEPRALAAGDTYEHTGKVAGLVSKNFVGDGVVTLGPDRTAAGARIVIEAKEKAETTLPLAAAEIEIGRKNRGAQVGVFVLSRIVAPAAFPTFTRRGDDLFVVWDAEDPSTDVRLESALSLAEALCTRAALHSEDRTTDLETLDRAVNEIEKQVATLDEIERIATTTANGAKDTLKRVEILRRMLTSQVETLRDGLKGLRIE